MVTAGEILLTSISYNKKKYVRSKINKMNKIFNDIEKNNSHDIELYNLLMTTMRYKFVEDVKSSTLSGRQLDFMLNVIKSITLTKMNRVGEIV